MSLVPGTVLADWQLHSMEDASRALECAVVNELFEPAENRALPADFAAVALALRRSVAVWQGATYVGQVTA